MYFLNKSEINPKKYFNKIFWTFCISVLPPPHVYTFLENTKVAKYDNQVAKKVALFSYYYVHDFEKSCTKSCKVAKKLQKSCKKVAFEII